MKIAFILPSSLMRYSSQGDFLYLLARDLRDDEEYYHECSQILMEKVIDNSVHEGKEVDWAEYTQLAIEQGVSDIIVPDVLDDAEKTKQSFMDFTENYGDELSGRRIWGVVQGKTEGEILEMYQFYLDQDVDIIGLSFTLSVKEFSKKKYLNYSLNRQHILSMIDRKFTEKKPLHLLGYSGYLELIQASQFPWVSSTDGKLVGRVSKAREKLENFPYNKPPEKLNMKDTFDEEQKKFLTRNISKLIQWVNLYEVKRRIKIDDSISSSVE